MARSNYPGSKSEAGVVAARNCNAPCGGWVVLYDRSKKGCLPKLTVPVDETGRYVLVHRPSGTPAWGFRGIEHARKYLGAAAKGEDALGILPRTVAVPAEAESLRSARGVTPENCGELSGSGGSLARARDREPLLPVPVPVDGLNFHLEFKRKVHEAFKPDYIVEKIHQLMEATKVVSVTVIERNAEGEMTGEPEKSFETVPDFYAIERGIRLAVEYCEGKPNPRPETKEPKKISFNELGRMLGRSPAARKAMLELVAEKEREAGNGQHDRE